MTGHEAAAMLKAMPDRVLHFEKSCDIPVPEIGSDNVSAMKALSEYALVLDMAASNGHRIMSELDGMASYLGSGLSSVQTLQQKAAVETMVHTLEERSESARSALAAVKYQKESLEAVRRRLLCKSVTDAGSPVFIK